jgi:hypothetical protein
MPIFLVRRWAMKRTQLFVRIAGIGEAKAEGIVAVVAVGIWAAVGTWVLSRWEDGVFSFLRTVLASVTSLAQAVL